MTGTQVIDAFREAGALLEGHFLYASGRHGKQFLQAARVLQYPNHTEAMCKAMADLFADADIGLVCGPATGGIVLAYETARHLNCRSVFTEKEPDGAMALKRGFRLDPGTRVLVVEDVITTGGSVKKTIDHLTARGANVVGACVLIDRSGGEASFECRFESLAQLEMESWNPDDCALCKAGEDVIDPDDIII
ncbi:MAG: orotate phosphoribosyltransferase [bacterium]|nr:orotate phosphoribosyltransferase [bacterium]